MVNGERKLYAWRFEASVVRVCASSMTTTSPRTDAEEGHQPDRSVGFDEECTAGY